MIPLPISIPDLRCRDCGTDTGLMCFDPGEPEVREQGILLKAERPVTARCLQCLIGASSTAEGRG